MSKKNKKTNPVVPVSTESNTHKQGEFMSQESQQPETSADAANAQMLGEAAGTKPNPTTGDQPPVTEAKKEEKGGVISLVTSVPSLAWNKAIVPAYQFVKEMVLRAWEGLVNLYHSEVAAFKELGPATYFLGRGAKLGIKLFKVIAAAAAVAFINNMLFNLTGISIFDPITLGIIALVALIFVVASSYNTQKKMSGEFSMGATGRHITEAVLAA
jgi:hypothetical protein